MQMHSGVLRCHSDQAMRVEESLFFPDIGFYGEFPRLTSLAGEDIAFWKKTFS